MKKYLLLPLLILFFSAFKQAGSETYVINDTVQNFSLINALTNNTVSLSDYSKSKAVVIVFSSPGCAFCKIYDERLVQLAKDFEGKEVNFLFINPNNPAASSYDNMAAMVSTAKEKGYTFPFLIDSNQKIAKMFGATKTPETFVLKNINGSFVLKYKGAIDDNPQLATDVTATYLKDAIRAVITNTPIKISEKRATGCVIKK